MTQRLALVFIVLLRIAIGWHFGFEGLEKRRSLNLGPTVTNKPWTSEPYFQEGNGPLASFVKSRIADPDDLLLARMTARQFPPRPQMPEVLDREWDNYLQGFNSYYGLDAEKQDLAFKIMHREKEQTVAWLTARPGSIAWYLSGQWTDVDHTPFKRTYPGGTYDVDIPVAERVDEYRAKVEEYRGLAGKRLQTMGRDVEKKNRPTVRAEMMALRTELQGLLDKRTDEMKKSLADAVLTKEQAKQRFVVVTESPAIIRWLDKLTIWTLLIVGGCLMLGLFSRLAALGGAGFLLMTLLTHPPLPWLPDPPNAEGHYVFVSKNVIEMLALLMLACIPTGRWFGLDAILHAINPFRKKEDED
jgi:uncharacterized membrane protein YphA (DoxX/SURF4 family)